MGRVKSLPVSRKRVWRISADAPFGKFVADDAQRPPRIEEPEPPPTGWALSSFELKYGLDVVEFEDTVPAPVVDEWFKKAGQ